MVAARPEHPAPVRMTPSLAPVPEAHTGLQDPDTASIPGRTEDIDRDLQTLLGEARPGQVKALTRDERRRTLAAANTIAGRVKLLTTRLVAAEAQSGDWAAEGDRTMEAWLGHHTGSGYGPAKSDVEMAQALEDLPALGQALEAGTVTVEHVKTTSRQYSNGSDAQKEALASPDGQADLVRQAQGEDAGSFGKHLNTQLAKVDAEKVERDHRAVRARRFVKLSAGNGGIRLEGFLDEIAGEYVRTALDAAMSRPATDDTRSSGNRRADALTAIAKHALDNGEFKSGGQVRPHVMVTLSAAVWADWQRAGHVPSRAPGATIGDGVPLAPSEIDTMLCDCRLMRAVLGTDGQPVDLGRDKRTFSTHLRKALLLRDRHCAWPGCGMPGEYAEGHHVDEWSNGGETKLARGVLICSYHHHYVHAHNIVITAIQGGMRFAHPDGRLIGEHHFERYDPPPDWAVGNDDTAADTFAGTFAGAFAGGDAERDAGGSDPGDGNNCPRNKRASVIGEKCAQEPQPPGRDPDPPPQLPLE